MEPIIESERDRLTYEWLLLAAGREAMEIALASFEGGRRIPYVSNLAKILKLRPPENLETLHLAGKAAQAPTLSVAVSLLESVKWISPTQNREECRNFLQAALTRIGECSNGSAECRVSVEYERELTFDLPPHYEDEIKSICRSLEALLVFGQEPDPDIGQLNGQCPVHPLKRDKARRSTTRRQLFVLQIIPSFPHFTQLLHEVQPGIRGWDLPLERVPWTSHVADPGSAGGALALWRQAQPSSAEPVAQYFFEFGVVLGWSPSAIRYVSKSPFETDNGAPLLLVRLSDAFGRHIGFQKIRMDTHGRRLVPFEAHPRPPYVLSVWKPRAVSAVTLIIEDAFLLQQLTRVPFVAVPSADSLRNYTPPSEVTSLDVYLPGRCADEFQLAAHDLAIRLRQDGMAVRLLEPAPEVLVDRGWWWQVLRGKSRIEEITLHVIPV